MSMHVVNDNGPFSKYSTLRGYAMDRPGCTHLSLHTQYTRYILVLQRMFQAS